LSVVKTCVKSLFRLCGLDIRRIRFEPYEWLKGRNIHTVFDIGANVGQFARQIHRVLPDAMLYSFEPLEDCYNELLKKMGHLPRFRAFNFALSDRNGQAEIYRNDFTPSSSLLPMEELHKRAFPFTEHARLQTIQIRRMDDILDKLHIVDNILVKIDVQGYEDKVIRGGQNVISQAKVLIVETTFETLYDGQPLWKDIFALLSNMGFSYMGNFSQMKSPLDDSILQADSIFVKKLVE
jgi:FkbM family methyltransferase